MKPLSIFLLFLSASLSGANSSAYRTAEMEETDASGYVLQTFAYVQNVLSEMKKDDRTISFELSEMSGPPPCTGDLCPMMPSQLKLTVFQKIRKSVTECGSTKFVGYALGKKMVLVDHTMRVCDDLKPYQWELKVLGKKKSVRYFRGNPKQVADSKCERFTQNTVCMMLYSPSTCSYGKTSAEGSNACFAGAELKKKLCEQGVDAEKVPEDQIICSIAVQPICPIPSCAAPPEGCTYEFSNEVTEAGCPKYPCGILKYCSQPLPFSP